MKYFVYRYLNKNNEIIYVGLTSRPLRQRVREHKIEELNKFTKKIQYIEVENEAKMHQWEDYFIDLYKPKYNKRDVHNGYPDINTKNDGKWLDYPVNGDTNQITMIIDRINNLYFNNTLQCFCTIVKKRNMIGVTSSRYIKDNGKIKREIVVGENDFFSNDKRMLIDIFSQMIQMYAEIDSGVIASNNGIYMNKNIKKYFDVFGVITKKTKYGFTPVNCTKQLIEEFSQFEYGYKNIKLLEENIKSKTSSTRKYIDESIGASTRCTKDHLFICFDDMPEVLDEIYQKYGKKPMVLVSE